MKFFCNILIALLITCSFPLLATPVRVILQTSKGDIILEIYQEQAPQTAAYFLDLIDRGLYNGANFYRSTTLGIENGPRLIQGGIFLDSVTSGDRPMRNQLMQQFSLSMLETVENSKLTGIKHKRGTVSFARDLYDTGYVIPEIFICEGDFPMLDLGGRTIPDTQGFPAFAKVIEGMDIVSAIADGEINGSTGLTNLKGQILTAPIAIIKAYRQSNQVVIE